MSYSIFQSGRSRRNGTFHNLESGIEEQIEALRGELAELTRLVGKSSRHQGEKSVARPVPAMRNCSAAARICCANCSTAMSVERRKCARPCASTHWQPSAPRPLSALPSPSSPGAEEAR